MWKRFLKDKSGSSLVLVMICMSFLILLAGAVITTTITNIYLKQSQKYTQENFYETDSVLDAVAAGIQNESSKASAEAYEQALGEYNVSLTSSGNSMDEKYARDFLDRMIKTLQGTSTGYVAGTTDYYYLDSVLKSYLKSSDEACYVEKTYNGVAGHGQMVLDGDALVLKGVKVIKAHSTQTDYETTLETDIRIEVPSVSTEANSEYLGYAILADDQIQANAGAIQATVNGNVYAGTVNRTKSADETKEAGILISGTGTAGDTKLTINADQIITRGDVYVNNAGTLDIDKSNSSKKNAELWVENIITKGTVGNHLTINASSYVADDMEIGGDNDQVSLAGKYYGYNFTDNYSTVPTPSAKPIKLSQTAAYSSSISLNGYEEHLRMDGLTELVLAGRTFISKKTKASEAYASGNQLQNPDIELGESLAVKSDQLSYLVAAMKENQTTGDVNWTDSFVKRVDALPSGTVSAIPAAGYGKTTYKRDDKNPNAACYIFTAKVDGVDVTFLFDYEAYEDYVGIPKNNDGSKKFDIEKWIDEGLINQAHPLQLYTRRDTSIAGLVLYFYLNFDDSKTASKFFEMYYNDGVNRQIYDEVNKSYVDAIGIQLPAASSTDYILSSGNIMYSANSAQPGKKGKIQLKLENSSQNPSQSFLKFAEDSSKIYMSKQLALVDDYEGAKNSTQWRLYDDNDANKPAGAGALTKSGWSNDKTKRTNLFDRLVDRDKMPVTQVLCDASKAAEVKNDAGGVKGKCWYIISNADVVWKNDTLSGFNATTDSVFILTTGSVTVENDLRGLIIAGDDVNLKNVTVTSDAEAISQLFEKDRAESTPVFYNIMSKYFRKSVDAMIGNDGTNSDTNNVTYENWKKND